jgi:hypothetical protein
MLSIKTNIAKFINSELRDIKNASTKATRSATTKTARQGATAGKQAVRAQYTIPASELNKATKIKSASSNDSSAKIIVTGKPLSMDKYRALKNKIKGATAMIIKGKRVTIPGDKTEGTKTFVTVMKSGHKGIFYRISKGKSTHASDPWRLPVKERKGPSAPDLMRSRYAINAITAFAKLNYERIFKSEYKFFKSK